MSSRVAQLLSHLASPASDAAPTAPAPASGEAPHPHVLFDMSGKVAVVTGGSRGLGRQMVLAFARLGADVVIASRKLDECEKVAAEVRALGRKALPISCHVAKWDECDKLFNATMKEFGKCDVLVNNAGMSPFYKSLADITEDYWEKVVGVNLRGPFRLSALFGTEMAKGAGGSIINVSSTASIKPSAIEVPYAAAKAGLNNLTMSTAVSFGPKVRCNCIVAGPFLTDISTAWDMEAFNKRAERFPLKRGGQPGEVVGLAVYLASGAGSFQTGECIVLDGGAHLSGP
ncbi:putative oxidoreductase [Hyaloraphidium curvatum]|nr:putative oxidoreductase [Hyaloraphidium curvatum]